MPHKGKDRTEALNKALNNNYDTVLYESPHRLQKALNEIAKKDPNRELFVAKELSKKYQKYYLGSAKELAKEFTNIDIKGEWIIVIKAKKDISKSLSFEEIMGFDMPPKIKAKMLSTLSDKSIKEWYEILIKN